MARRELNCPACTVPLQEQHDAGCIFWVCDHCAKMLVSMAVLRKIAHPDWCRDLWASTAEAPRDEVACPSCSQPMVRPQPDGPQLCRKCLLVWADVQAIENAAPPPEEPDPEEGLSDRSREALAMMKVEMLQERYEAEERRERTLDMISAPSHGGIVRAVIAIIRALLRV